jgi:glycosyltransferase involved in cell wall biosynthesis
MPALSATIITQNEAANIARAIRSLGMADEILIVDSGSTDGTQEIAAREGARVVSQPWLGFAAQKNFAVGQAAHDWILSLDADEELNLDAQDAVRSWKSGPEPGSPAGYKFARRAFYLGRWILHSGWYPDHKVRLFDRRRGRWEGNYVHESVVVEGSTERMPGEILHYTCDSLNDHKARIEFYTDLAAREMLARGRSPSALGRLFAPPWIFFHTFFLRLGILDGYAGLQIARMAARYVSRKYEKWALLKKGEAALPNRETHCSGTGRG